MDGIIKDRRVLVTQYGSDNNPVKEQPEGEEGNGRLVAKERVKEGSKVRRRMERRYLSLEGRERGR